ncbi:hypothetical protein BDN72DRAFT_179025 [Pluteus cervinus]|uniref:Uncharacterized protein n=1 Tax=Pluteus cervinus TaxID=181527 RepID=A0ACD3AIW3_9AGAR|nr:hypothetical protein BDN72DRAFT_179025 [Pluteus cervinus]
MVTIPAEVLRDVIELSAYSSYRQAATLARVCQAFSEWVRPVLFRVFKWYSYHNNFPQPSPLDVAWFQANGKYIRHMLWGQDLDLLVDCLELCPNIVDLAIWVDTDTNNIAPLFPAFSKLRLHRLSIRLPALYPSEEFTVEHAQQPVFSHLTHLDVVHSTAAWNEIAGIAKLPSLTHLALSDRIAINVVETAVKNCKNLQVVVLASLCMSVDAYNEDLTGESTIEAPWNSYGFDDPRVVAFECEFVGDWELAATGKRDMWAKAEEIVASRTRPILMGH